MTRTVLGSITVFVLLSMPGLGSAGVPSGTMRMHLDTLFLGYTFENWDPENGGEDSEIGTFEIGLGNPEIGIGLGYAIIDNLVLGARFTGYFETVNNDEADQKTNAFHWGALPYVEYVFSTQIVRPFVMGTTGFAGEVTSSEAGDWESDSATWAWVIGGGGGVHFFLARSFSLDLFGLFEYSIGKSSGDTNGNDWEGTSNVFQVSLVLGLSGWF